MGLWCKHQATDLDGSVLCMAHESDPRKLYCPYQDISERPKSKYPCLFYDERTKDDDLIDKINSVGSVNPVTPEEVRTLCIKT